MANRLMSNRLYTGRKDVKQVNAVVSIGASGAPTLDTTKSWGVAAVAKSATGRYKFSLGLLKDGAVVPDTYRDLIDVSLVAIGAANAAVPNAPGFGVYTDASGSTGEITLSTLVGVTETEPASGVKLLVTFTFADGSAP